eukprot:CAMPEP_0117429060 /NCGR_PEP_ID=MMETSP0758-20121206/8635_1 /TAXON_ID=63605 /ORGANISM="Percolomonas cosmopolitus, Strain AE-1 (ATCC 50343)" /LENGTH=150 /DNA_ID=CAMNT_0005215773 /DNA_START=124 /DNA_END=574 /DNA_ORIENTATION=-
MVFIDLFYDSIFLSSSFFAKAKPDPEKYIKKKKFVRVRELFPTEESLQKHLAQKIVDHHPENYGREGYTLDLPFYKDERAAIKIKARSEYPDWLFDEATYRSYSLAELEQIRLDNNGELPENLSKTYQRLSNAAKLKLHNKYGDKWKAYY